MSSLAAGRETQVGSSDEEEDFGPVFTELATEAPSLKEDEENVKKAKERERNNGDEGREGRKLQRLESDQEEEDLGPSISLLKESEHPERHEKQQKQPEELPVNLPITDFYECSFMHKKQVSHVASSHKTGFFVTASIDGVVKFWRLRSDREVRKDLDEGTRSGPLVATSLEFVKGFQAHGSEISDISVSNCEFYLASLSEKEKNVKLFSILDFDMISIIKVPIYPSKCVFVGGSALGTHKAPRAGSSTAAISTGFGVIYPQLALSEVNTGNIYIYTIRGNTLKPGEDAGRFSNHKHPISCIKYLVGSEMVISADFGGGLEFWNPWTLSLPKVTAGENSSFGISFKFKIDTDLFELQKNKCFATNIAVSKHEKLLAIGSSDFKIRIFSVQEAKCLKIIGESISSYNILQGNMEFNHLHLDRLEFGIRSAVETEIQTHEYYNMQNLVFDETNRYLIYPSMIGICVLDVTSFKRVSTVGKFENGKRFLNLALLQIHRGVGESAGQKASNVDSVILASAYKSNRVFVFSKRLPLLENGEVNLDRDIFNELPTTDELERKKLLQQFSDKRSIETSHKRIAKKVILHTTKGDISLELYPEIAPKACENFSVHCHNGYYNNCIFHRVIKGFMIQTGDPTGEGIGGASIWGRDFEDEISPQVKHDQPFTLSMANAGPNTNASQFFITTIACPWLDGVHTIFGRVTEGKEIVQEIEHVSTNNNDRPIQDVLIISASAIF
ncbi:peptidyl-prolyl cis-trans isomerase CYP71 [Cryptosporidium felis]|nr:peptidyl-prolyl cis-trans isomerase CYP71 [Cryptosporidium felis]